MVYNAIMLVQADSALAPFPDKTLYSQLLRRAVGVDISMEYLDEQAKVRTGIGSPSKQFDGLPMFD